MEIGNSSVSLGSDVRLSRVGGLSTGGCLRVINRRLSVAGVWIQVGFEEGMGIVDGQRVGGG